VVRVPEAAIKQMLHLAAQRACTAFLDELEDADEAVGVIAQLVEQVRDEAGLRAIRGLLHLPLCMLHRVRDSLLDGQKDHIVTPGACNDVAKKLAYQAGHEEAHRQLHLDLLHSHEDSTNLETTSDRRERETQVQGKGGEV